MYAASRSAARFKYNQMLTDDWQHRRLRPQRPARRTPRATSARRRHAARAEPRRQVARLRLARTTPRRRSSSAISRPATKSGSRRTSSATTWSRATRATSCPATRSRRTRSRSSSRTDGKIWRVDVATGARDGDSVHRRRRRSRWAPLAKFEYPINDSTLTVAQIRGAAPSPDGKRLAFTALDKLWIDGSAPGVTRARCVRIA